MITAVARLNFKIDDELHKRAKHAAIDLKIPLREFVEQAVAEKVERFERERGGTEDMDER